MAVYPTFEAKTNYPIAYFLMHHNGNTIAVDTVVNKMNLCSNQQTANNALHAGDWMPINDPSHVMERYNKVVFVTPNTLL